MEETGDNNRIRALEAQLTKLSRENDELRSASVPNRHRLRQVLAIIALALGLIATLPAEVFIWANRTITNTDNYVHTVGPIIHEPTVQAAITKAATTGLFAHVDIQQEVSNVLPPQAQLLAGPITVQVKNFITGTVKQVVASPQFAQVWVKTNQQAQITFMKVAQKSGGNPNINVNQIYGYISHQLQGTPLGALANHTLPASVGQITVVTIPALARIPHFVATLSALSWSFLAAAIALLILGLALARNRARMAAWIGLGWMTVTVLGVIAARITRNVLLAQIPDQTYRAAAQSVWQALLTPLYLQATILFSIGLVVAVLGWAMGTSRTARRLQHWTSAHLGGWRHNLWPAADSASWTKAIRSHRLLAHWIILALTILALMALIPLTLPTLTAVLVMAAVIWLALEFLAAPTPG